MIGYRHGEGAHFLPYAWYFDSRGYLLLSVATGGGAALAAFVCAGLATIEAPFVVVPLVCVLSHAVASWMLWDEVARLEASAEREAAAG